MNRAVLPRHHDSPTYPLGVAFQVVGGNRLSGTVRVPGAKNSILKLMAAALLAQGPTTLTEVPDILDVTIMAEPLRRLGCEVVQDREAGTVVIDVPAAPGHLPITTSCGRCGRRSVCSARWWPASGKPMSRCPGGDAIGSRGLDMHVNGLTRLGAEVSSEHGFLIAKAGQLHGASIWLDFLSGCH